MHNAKKIKEISLDLRKTTADPLKAEAGDAKLSQLFQVKNWSAKYHQGIQ